MKEDVQFVGKFLLAQIDHEATTMSILIAITIGVLSAAISGFLVYLVMVIIVPERYRRKFFDFVPLYPKFKYAVLLYLLAGLFYILIPWPFHFTITLFVIDVDVFSGFICLVVAAQIVKFISKWRKEALEESFEDEMQRKRAWRY